MQKKKSNCYDAYYFLVKTNIENQRPRSIYDYEVYKNIVKTYTTIEVVVCIHSITTMSQEWTRREGRGNAQRPTRDRYLKYRKTTKKKFFFIDCLYIFELREPSLK